MILKQFKETLEANKSLPLHIMLPSGELVPEHFHVTEVGCIYKKFVDCGGTKRESKVCSIQVWVANDVDHRLSSEKLLSILNIASDDDFYEDLPIEIEYGDETSVQYKLVYIEKTSGRLLLMLSGKQTNCLAPDKCGVGDCC